jgi:hypothetical protein
MMRCRREGRQRMESRPAGGALALSLCLILFAGAALAQGKKPAPGAHSGKPASSRISPSGTVEPVKIQTGGKTITYAKAIKARPVDFPVQGPASIRILDRFLSWTAPSRSRYTMRIEVDGAELREVSGPAAFGHKAVVRGGAKAGALKKTLVHVPAGLHKIRVYPVDDGVALAVRAVPGTRKRSIEWTLFAPETYERVLRIHVKDNESTVYRLTPEKAVSVSIIGPMKVRVVSRLDFGPANGTTQAYVLKVALNGKPWRSFPLKSRASHTAVYPEMSEISPGMAEASAFSVPSGRTLISIALDGTTAAGGTVQIFVPKKALKVTAGNAHGGAAGRTGL